MPIASVEGFAHACLRRSITTVADRTADAAARTARTRGIVVGGAGREGRRDHLVAHRVVAVDRPPAARARGQQEPELELRIGEALGVGEQRAHRGDVVGRVVGDRPLCSQRMRAWAAGPGSSASTLRDQVRDDVDVAELDARARRR